MLLKKISEMNMFLKNIISDIGGLFQFISIQV